MSLETMKQALDALDCLIYDKPYAGRFADALIGLRTAIQQAEAQQVENSTATPSPVKLHKECATMPNYERCDECQQSTPKPVAWVSTDSIGERYLCFTKPFDDPDAKPLVHPVTAVSDMERGWRACCDVPHML